MLSVRKIRLSAIDKDSADRASGIRDSSSQMSYSDVTVEQAAGLINSEPDIVVLDVRTPAEFAAGHIEGAINVDFMSHDFERLLAQLDSGKRYVMHCKSGGRSTRALSKMRAAGFDQVSHMVGGFDGWEDAGKSVYRPETKPNDAS